MKKLPAYLRKSLNRNGLPCRTVQAFEYSLGKRLRYQVSRPACAVAARSNENTYGLLRQSLPRGINPSTVSQTELNDIAKLLNAGLASYTDSRFIGYSLLH
jgi:IS30 family transposase